MKLLERSPWKIVRLYRAGQGDSVPRPVPILALGGSLRAASFNRALLHEAAAVAPAGLDLDLGVLDVPGALPLYDQDLVDRDGFPAAAVRLKDALRAADGLLIATPEYNWSIPGFLKNAIDWASRPSGDIPEVFGDLPVALVGHSLGGRAALLAGNAAGVRCVVALNPWVLPSDRADLRGRRVLVVHGTDDRVAPPSRSADLVRRLRDVGTDVEHVLVPGGKHAMLRYGRNFESRASEFVVSTLLD